MLLTEIVSTDRIVRTKGVPDIKGEPLGSGLFAKVYPGRKTNTVIKVARVDSPKDGYIEFIREVLNNPHNPFFPRIYNAKLYLPEQSDDYYFVVEMEKLRPLMSDQLKDAAPHILSQLHVDFEKFIQETGLLKKHEQRSGLDQRIGSVLDKIFSNPQLLGKIRKHTNNEQLAEAISAYMRLLKNHQHDMHEENIMVRLTNVGPQLVFTDPVAST